MRPESKCYPKASISERPRGFYCAIGNCSSCHMTVNGVANVKTCITPLELNMVVEMQTAKGGSMKHRRMHHHRRRTGRSLRRVFGGVRGRPCHVV
ncbi:MAG: (2Fe-2S)-binding protein [Bacillus subtilis]|nr:(2Fe-2S)-binding protein [Bacillus subtilis]